MQVILLERIENLGGIGDQVKVKSGYGRNFLLPQGKATMATPENIKKFEAVRAELEAKAANELERAEARAEKLRNLRVTITAKAGAEGKLFGSVGPLDIAEACVKAGEHVERSEVRLHEGPLRMAGEHEVELHLHSDVNVPLSVLIVAEGATPEEIAALTAGSDEATDATDATDATEEPTREAGTGDTAADIAED